MAKIHTVSAWIKRITDEFLIKYQSVIDARLELKVGLFVVACPNRLLNLTPFLAYGMFPDGNYRQIFFIIFGPDKISCLFNKILGNEKDDGK